MREEPKELPDVTTPVESTETALELVVQVQLDVTFWVEPSLKVAVTVSCLVELTGTNGLDGVICKPLVLRAGVVTVRFVLPIIPLRVALITVVPTATVVATPLLALIVAIPITDEFQVDAVVLSAVVPSE